MQVVYPIDLKEITVHGTPLARLGVDHRFFASGGATMNRKLPAAAALAVASLLWGQGAQAAQITFGPSAEAVSFTGTPPIL